MTAHHRSASLARTVQPRAGVHSRSADGRTPGEQLALVDPALRQFHATMTRTWEGTRKPALHERTWPGTWMGRGDIYGVALGKGSRNGTITKS